MRNLCGGYPKKKWDIRRVKNIKSCCRCGKDIPQFQASNLESKSMINFRQSSQ